MANVGFSTGALAKGDIARGIDMAHQLGLRVIELSALRLRELDALINVVASHTFNDFSYVALHAPAAFDAADEPMVVSAFLELSRTHNWPVVVHPDAISDFDLWLPLGSMLFVENMDKRKPRGRTVEELEEALAFVPEAQICFDIAHARQVDSSMTEAFRILRTFRSRIRHVHFSEIGSDSRHREVSHAAFRAYSEIAAWIPSDIPVVIESVVTDSAAPLDEATQELQRVTHFLNGAAERRFANLSSVVP